MGHVVSKCGIKDNPTKIDVVNKWEILKRLTWIWIFLDLVRYYKRIIKYFSKTDTTFECINPRGNLLLLDIEIEVNF